MFAINYEGLRKRDSYEEILNYIHNQPLLKYPERSATRLIQSPYFTKFNGGASLELDDQEKSLSMEKMKQEILRAIAGSGGKGIGKLRAATRPPAPVFSMTPTGGSDMEEDIDVEAGEEAKRRQLRMSAASSQALDALAR